MNSILLILLILLIWSVFQHLIFLPPPFGMIINVIFLVIFIVVILQLAGVNTGISFPRISR